MISGENLTIEEQFVNIEETIGFIEYDITYAIHSDNILENLKKEAFPELNILRDLVQKLKITIQNGGG